MVSTSGQNGRRVASKRQQEIKMGLQKPKEYTTTVYEAIAIAGLDRYQERDVNE